MTTRHIGILLLALTLAACAATPTVGTDFDRAVNFAPYHRFGWLPRTHPAARNPLNAKRIEAAIRSELEAKGFEFSEDLAQADIAIDFTLSAQERTDIASYPVEWRLGWHWGRGYFGEALDVRQYREGTLAIDVFEARHHEPVWHGWAKKPLSEADLKDPGPGLRQAVAAVLAHFPPGASH